jgi:hypothetical protein
MTESSTPSCTYARNSACLAFLTNTPIAFRLVVVVLVVLVCRDDRTLLNATEEGPKARTNEQEEEEYKEATATSTTRLLKRKVRAGRT